MCYIGVSKFAKANIPRVFIYRHAEFRFSSNKVKRNYFLKAFLESYKVRTEYV